MSEPLRLEQRINEVDHQPCGDEGGELLATGHTLHACWNPATARMIPIPDWLKEIMPDADLDPAPAPR